MSMDSPSLPEGLQGAEINPRTTNAVLSRAYLEWLTESRGRNPQTARAYRYVIDPFLDWVGDTPLGEVKVGTIEAFLMRPRGGRAHGQPGSAATRQRDGSVIRALYDYLLARGSIATSPAKLLGSPKVHNENPRPIPDDHWNLLWSHALEPAERVFLGLGFFAGLRRQEIASLTPAHVHAHRGALVNFVRKGGGDDVTPYADMAQVIGDGLPRLLGHDTFGEELAKYARERVDEPHLLEWSNGNLQLLNNRMQALCARAESPHYTPHQLRHSAATNLLRCNVPLHIAQRLMNHSSPQITMRYVRAGASELREWMDRR